MTASLLQIKGLLQRERVLPSPWLDGKVAIEQSGGAPGLGETTLTATAGISHTQAKSIARSFETSFSDTLNYDCDGEGAAWVWQTMVEEYTDPLRRGSTLGSVNRKNKYVCTKSDKSPPEGGQRCPD